MSLALHPLVKLIAEGEGQSLDFKKTISSARKIARTLAAFANTHGGSLLIGVKDNGKVTGVRSGEEEVYMIDSASKIFCKPEVKYVYVQHDYKGLPVVQVIVPKGLQMPYKAQTDDGEWKTYHRLFDHTVLASSVMNEVLIRQAKGLGVQVKFAEVETNVLKSLDVQGRCTLDALSDRTGIKRYQLTPILASLIQAGLVREQQQGGVEYYLAVAPVG